MRSALTTLAAAFFPTLALLVMVEVFLRARDVDQPRFRTALLTAGAEEIHRYDDLLFFSLRPDIDTSWAGVRVRTNALGLRSPEVGPPSDREFRILSLGESTTFGALVEAEDTYSARLEELLRERDPSRPYAVINAGVSAYSSFQSLLYLRERGLALEPDLVLFYHEINDYLPSSIRAAAYPGSGSADERWLGMTDIEIHESRHLRLRRFLLQHLALARVISQWRGREQLSGLDPADVFPHGAGLEAPEAFQRVHTPEGLRQLNLPPRVTPEQRVGILDELITICERNEVKLLIIHPSYARSKRHECELTEFCARRDVPMLEAHDVLHPPGAAATTLFRDAYHPRAAGHQALAKAIRDALVREGLLPRLPLPEPRLPGSKNELGS